MNETKTGEPRKFATNSVQMLRTVQSNTLALSQMADQKASILMGATFVVFSIAIGRALEGEMPWSLTVLAVFAFLSSLSAAWAVMPSILRPPQVPNGQQNPLFFGHFTYRDEKEWADEFLGQMQDEETMFRMMLRDLYQNGLVLQRRKYRYLTYAYRLFIAGMVLTLAVAAIEYSLV
ncbi:Pycsar system effector family protein [Aurantiacibacter odishensis]|uniref:Pycsar system effector family protein n=1 Tax=Aurantiacibacter odishensis TaxID=1155476 RepID=UPI000E74B437|nr:Pycsar system effector family protein [Aurantiacibacter odishensis]